MFGDSCKYCRTLSRLTYISTPSSTDSSTNYMYFKPGQTYKMVPPGAPVQPHTLHASIGGAQVGLELSWTRLGFIESLVRDADAALAPAGALLVENISYISVAAHVAIVHRHAPSDGHASVLSCHHHCHLTAAAHWPKFLRLAIVLRACK
jgi:hypothetical protein